MVNRLIFPGILILAATANLFAQSPHFRIHTPEEEFLTTDAEIVYEGPNRQLWIGTNQGLLSYDGLEYALVHQPDTGNTRVTAIWQDSSDLLWIGYADGRIFRGRPGQLLPWKPEGAFSSGTPVSGIIRDISGNLWVSTYGDGLFCQDTNSVHFLNLEEGLPSADIYCLALSPEGDVWAGTDGGVVVARLDLGELNIRVLDRTDGLPDEIVRSIISDQAGKMWLGTHERGICWYDSGQDSILQPETSWPDGVIRSLAATPGKGIWIGTESSGLFRFLPSEGIYRSVQSPESPVGKKIYDLTFDREGNLWVLDNGQGILSANLQFEQIQVTNMPALQCMLIDNQQRVWVGTESGLYQFLPGTNEFKHVFREVDLNLISLFEDPFGNIWLGSFGNGVIILNSETGQFRRLSPKEGLANGSILSIAGTGERVWLATLGGVSEIDLSENPLRDLPMRITNFDHQSGLGTNFVYQVFIDSQDQVWFATDGRGLCRLINGRIECFQSAVSGTDTLEFRNVYSITEDLSGTIWFSTPKDGLFSFDGESFSHLARKEGIRDLSVTGLATDAAGNILIIHPSGIDLLNPEKNHFIYFDEAVGIFDFDPNLNGFAISPQGDIWIADSDLLLQYAPIENLAIHPRTSIKRVLVLLEQIEMDATPQFAHRQNQFIFEYSGIWYTDPQSIRFRYKLEGFDPDWIYSRDRQATYSSLPPGEYTFRVSSTENDAFDQEPISSWHFRILPPLWQRWWFLLLAISLLSLGVYHFLRLRDRRKNRINTLERARLHSELEAIKSQINPHFLFNNFNTLAAIIEEDPDAAVEYVEQLSDFYRSLLQYREQDLISLEEEIALVRNYEFLLKKRYGRNIILDIRIPANGAFLAPLTLQLLVENAVKHNVISASKPLHIEIFTRDDYVVVRNNLQLKFRPERSTGFGLESIRQRYQLLTNRPVEIQAESHFFQVAIPCLKKPGNGTAQHNLKVLKS